MRRSLLVAVTAALLTTGLAGSQMTHTLCEGFLPENDMKIGIGTLEDKGITPAQFNEVLDGIQEIY